MSPQVSAPTICARHPVTTAHRLPSSPTHPGSSILIDSCPKGLLTEGSNACCWTCQELTNPCRCQVLNIDMLPDEILLAIFDFFVDEDAHIRKDAEAWQSLVHVCRRWRSVIFGSPRRLNLRLICGSKTSIRDTLAVWPPMPLEIRGGVCQTKGVNNILAGLQLSDRVCRIDLWAADIPLLEKILAAMQEPFPELTDLVMDLFFETVSVSALPIVPDSFLDGSAPRLQKLHLDSISFPGLPKLLLSTTHLVDLQLCNIPHSGYFSPEAMATAFSILTSLKLLTLEFRFFQSRPDRTSQRPPPTRSLLPVLDTLRFEGATEYLDELVAHIDAPRLNNLNVAFFNTIISDISQFIQFICRTSTLEVLETAHIYFRVDSAVVRLSSKTSGYRELNMKISCGDLEMEILRVCTSYLPPLSVSKDLYIYETGYPRRNWQDDDTLWLELLRQFTSVKNLYLSDTIATCIARILQELLVGGRTTELFPALENISFEGIQMSKPIPEGIEKFISARQLSGHPIAVSSVSPYDMRNSGLRNSMNYM